MKQLLIVSGLVMSMSLGAMDNYRGAGSAEGAKPLELSPEVQNMPTNPLKRSPKKVSPETKKAITNYFNHDLASLCEKYRAQERLELEKNNN